MLHLTQIPEPKLLEPPNDYKPHIPVNAKRDKRGNPRDSDLEVWRAL